MANDKVMKEPVEKKLIQLVGGTRVSDLMHPDEQYKLTPNAVADGELIVGLELEIENFRNRPMEYFGFVYHEDNSLRNVGVEWVTTPTRLKFLEPLLNSFYERAKLTDDNFSERCSVHVHVNCQDMTLPQISNVVLLYQIFERMLFDYVGNERDKNIFCVPWSQANTCINIYNVINKWDFRMLRNWQKYTALNLLPLTSRGTVEYRHMHGTQDVQKIMTWVNLLACIHNYAKSVDAAALRETVMELNTSSAYEALLHNVFKQWEGVLSRHINYRPSMEAGVLDAKICLSDGGLPQRVNPAEELDFFTVQVEQIAERQRAGHVGTEAAQEQLRELAQRMRTERAQQQGEPLQDLPAGVTITRPAMPNLWPARNDEIRIINPPVQPVNPTDF